jgi:ribose 5-phosphate isomerase B
MTKIALAADHAGYEEKEKIKRTLDEMGVEYVDMGTASTDSVDYPDFAQKVGEAVSKGEFEQGLLVCGSGTGMAIAANKVKGIRAALCWTAELAQLAREHNNAQVVSIGGRFTATELAKEIVDVFVGTEFSGVERHVRRLEMVTRYEDDGTLPPEPATA